MCEALQKAPQTASQFCRKLFSKLLHGSDGGLRFSQPATKHAPRTMTVEALDSGVVCLGEPNGFPIHLSDTDPWRPPDVARHGASTMLFNNLWNTNYVMWQPYRKDGQNVSGADDFAFRYTLSWA